MATDIPISGRIYIMTHNDGARHREIPILKVDEDTPQFYAFRELECRDSGFPGEPLIEGFDQVSYNVLVFPLTTKPGKENKILVRKGTWIIHGNHRIHNRILRDPGGQRVDPIPDPATARFKYGQCFY